MKKAINKFLTSSFALLVFSGFNSASPATVFQAAGPDAADIQATVGQFRDDLGTLNPNVAQSFLTGRREINWDAIPDGFSSPNALPANFFNANSPRGAVFSTPCSDATFRVSADSANPTNTAVLFGEIDPSYTDTFKTFSPERLFAVVSSSDSSCSRLTVHFFLPGTNIQAETTGFGSVFADVDIPGHVRIIAYDKDGSVLDPGILTARRSDGGLSFVGVSYPDPVVARVDIVSGKSGLFPGLLDSIPGKDVVVMDDFIYGEPQAIQ